MIIQTKDLAKDTDGDMSTYERSSDTHHLTTMTRIVGVCTAVGILSRRPRRDRNDPSVFTSNEEGMKREKHSAFHYRMKVVCGVGADVAYHRHVMGLYVTAASGVIFFLEVTWAITLFVQLCVRNEDSLCSCCWSTVLTTTRGWRKALLYLPLSCVLAWRPNRLWLSYVADTVCSRPVGGIVLAAYCIECIRTTRFLPIERRNRFRRRESLELQAGQLRSLRGSPSNGGSR
ncbi:uncharacterized protein LOC105252542 isoform X2 [Camponotus floridanus]|uniref:uncharacterized protein LOC105252542 isoform X2 n=1 Tax=Camponotus floridanus TaxID=104421 RepID=UPI00059B5608|nr:uncharacterized protein LOC105252542 isoform X2 [Camponotus floridanus]